MAEPLLRVENVSKTFSGLLAVDGASLTVQAGRITALIGPNGAGKTTLFAMISGFLAPSAGRIFHRGEDITGVPPIGWRGAASRARSDRTTIRRLERAREYRSRRVPVATLARGCA